MRVRSSRVVCAGALFVVACGGSPATDAAVDALVLDVSADRSESNDASSSDTGVDAASTDGAPDATVVDSGVSMDTGAPADAAVNDASVSVDCMAANVRCVDDTPGPNAEYATIMAAVRDAVPGDTVVVFAGEYAGFQLDRSGTEAARIVVRALGGAVINRDGPSPNGVRMQNVSYVTVEGFVITMATEQCVAARGATATTPMVGNIVRGVTCQSSGTEGFYLSQWSRGLVEGCRIARTGRSGSTRSHGIYLANGGTDDTVVRDTTIDMTGSPAESAGIHCNGDLSIGGDGMISGLTIERNTISGLAHNAINMDGVERSRIVNNVVHTTTRHGVRGYRIDAARGPQGLVVANNTFVIGGTSSGVRLTEDRGGHVIFNNIFVVTRDGSSISLEASDRAMVGPNALDTGGVVLAAPSLFRNAAANDLELAVGSAAIGAGVARFAAQDAPAVDRLGRARARFDLGAYRAP